MAEYALLTSCGRNRGPSVAELDSFYEQHVTNSPAQSFYATVIGLANAADASEIVAVGYILDVFKDAGEVSNFAEAMLAAAMFAGMLLGGVVLGFCSDRFGRRGILVWTLAINAFAGLISAVAPHIGFLVLARFVGGVGIGGSIPACFALVAELTAPAQRGRAIMWIAWNWVFGSLFTAASAWLILGYLGASWRYLAVVSSLPAVVGALLSHLYLPESPYFDLSQNRIPTLLSSLRLLAQQHTAPQRATAALAAVGRMEREWKRRLLSDPSNDEDDDSNDEFGDGNGGEKFYSSDNSKSDTSNGANAYSDAGNETDCLDDYPPSQSLSQSQKQKLLAGKSSPNASGVAVGSALVAGSSLSSDAADFATGDSLGGSGDGRLSGTTLAQHRSSPRLTPAAPHSGGNSMTTTIATTAAAAVTSGGSRPLRSRPNATAAVLAGSPVPPTRSRSLSTLNMTVAGVFSALAAEFSNCFAIASTLFQGKLFRITLLLQFVWFSLSFSTYGFSVWVPALFAHVGFKSSRFADAFIFTLAQVPACALGTYAVDHASVGRRRLLVAGALLTTLCTGIFAVEHSDKTLALVLVCLYQVFTTLAWNALDCLATESFPAPARSTAFALQAAAGRVGAILGQFMFSYLIDVSVTMLLGACAAITVFTALAGLALPAGLGEEAHAAATCTNSGAAANGDIGGAVMVEGDLKMRQLSLSSKG